MFKQFAKKKNIFFSFSFLPISVGASCSYIFVLPVQVINIIIDSKIPRVTIISGFLSAINNIKNRCYSNSINVRAQRLLQYAKENENNIRIHRMLPDRANLKLISRSNGEKRNHRPFRSNRSIYSLRRINAFNQNGTQSKNARLLEFYKYKMLRNQIKCDILTIELHKIFSSYFNKTQKWLYSLFSYFS